MYVDKILVRKGHPNRAAAVKVTNRLELDIKI
jgi:hypothetical protein